MGQDSFKDKQMEKKSKIPEPKDSQQLLTGWNETRLRKDTYKNFAIDGEVIVGPRDLITREMLINKYLRPRLADLDKDACPTVVFLWELGQGPAKYKRRGTRIGGTPWWPASKQWPCDSEGTPLRFVVQIDFGLKHSLEVKLPGELLSIFVSENEGFWGEIKFFWHNPSPGIKLLVPDKVPPPDTSDEYDFGPFFGHPYSTSDYKLYDISSPREHFGYARLLEVLMPDIGQPDLVPIVQATKIGGIPHFVQGRPSDEWKASWKYVCSISSVWNKFGRLGTPEGLFVNQPEFLPKIKEFMFGDVGQIYVFLDNSGKIKYWSDCN